MCDSRLVVESMDLDDETIDVRRLFRDFTNSVVGRGLSVPDNNLVFFGYKVSHGGLVKVLACVGTVRPARPADGGTWISPPPYTIPSEDWSAELMSEGEVSSSSSATSASSDKDPDDTFLHPSCHIVEYLFTDKYYRRSGYGGQVLEAMEQSCRKLNCNSPFRLWAASNAVRFFRSYGYHTLADKPSITTTHAVHIFRNLYPMEKSASDRTQRKLKPTKRRQTYRGGSRHSTPMPV